ncbi:MAG: thioredoxin family protein [Alphaproteobacteria bacterium]|nr:thioredoxin family protein [Alphaproteobacteria bacterium]
MKKDRKSRNTSSKSVRKAGRAATSGRTDKGRRSFLRTARNGAIGLAVVGGIGFLFVRNVSSTMHEHDLTRVQNGKPTIVQIHDPQCSSCAALQRETKQALKNFDTGELDYVIANIKTPEGRNFANRYGAQHVTLLLFDGEGALQGVLQGQRGRNELRFAFERLLSG